MKSTVGRKSMSKGDDCRETVGEVEIEKKGEKRREVVCEFNREYNTREKVAGKLERVKARAKA
jgi:hypothetical protein